MGQINGTNQMEQINGTNQMGDEHKQKKVVEKTLNTLLDELGIDILTHFKGKIEGCKECKTDCKNILTHLIEGEIDGLLNEIYQKYSKLSTNTKNLYLSSTKDYQKNEKEVISLFLKLIFTNINELNELNLFKYRKLLYELVNFGDKIEKIGNYYVIKKYCLTYGVDGKSKFYVYTVLGENPFDVLVYEKDNTEKKDNIEKKVINAIENNLPFELLEKEGDYLKIRYPINTGLIGYIKLGEEVTEELLKKRCKFIRLKLESEQKIKGILANENNSYDFSNHKEFDLLAYLEKGELVEIQKTKEPEKGLLNKLFKKGKKY